MSLRSKLRKTLTLGVLLLAVTGCAASTKSGNIKPELAVTQKCQRPVKLPDRELTQVEVEKYWLKDRKALIQCGVTKEALISWLKKNGRL